VVVHNAGITRDKKLANMAEDRWDSVMAVNLIAPERITRELLDQGVVNDNGRIVGVASIAGIAGNVGQTNYAASKAGVIGLVDSLADELKDGITINAVAPGFIETEMTGALPEGRKAEIIKAVPAGRLAHPDEVAAAVTWLASDSSAYISGAVIPVDGGLGMGH
jgi:3-oxoacyl-[acyl-carrier protein] reductase